MRAMDRLAEAALRKEAHEETTATTTAAAATTATKRSADAVPEGERTAKVPTPAEVRGEIRSRAGQGEAPEKRLKRNEVGMLSTFDAEEYCSGSLRVISPTTVSDPTQVKDLLWTQGSKCVLGTDLVSNKTKALITNIQLRKKCEYVCLYHDREVVPSNMLNSVEDHLIGIGEVVAATNPAAIAEALEQVARSGLERKWVCDGFETVGSEGLANIVFEAVPRSGTNWIWKEDPVVDIIGIVDDVDITDIDVPVGSIDK